MPLAYLNIVWVGQDGYPMVSGGWAGALSYTLWLIGLADWIYLGPIHGPIGTFPGGGGWRPPIINMSPVTYIYRLSYWIPWAHYGPTCVDGGHVNIHLCS
jgi:hypothetical protein